MISYNSVKITPQINKKWSKVSKAGHGALPQNPNLSSNNRREVSADV